MKIGNMEGSPKEIRDLLDDHDMRLADFLAKPEEPLAPGWIIVPAVLIVIALVCLALIPDIPKAARMLLFLLGNCTAIWLGISILVRFKNGWAGAMAVVGVLIVMLIAAGFISPVDSLDAIKKMQAK